jgi:hypothetical protein
VSGATGNTSVEGEVSFYMPSNAVTVTANFALIPEPTPTPTQEPTPTPTQEPEPTPTPTQEPEPTPTPTIAPTCYYYTNNSMLNFGGSVNLCGGGVGYEDILIGQESANCLANPPADGFTETTAC